MVRKSLWVAVAAIALSMPLNAQFIGCPDINPASSASNNTFPMGFDPEWRYQMLLPASCFPAARFKITDMAFAQHGTFNSSHPGTYGPFQVRMALTTASALTNNFDANLGPCPVTVMNKPSLTWAWAPDTWVDLGLDCQFAYDGVRNLVFEIRYTGGSSASIPCRAENPVGGYRAYTRGPGASTATTATSVLTTSLMKTRFTIDRTCVLWHGVEPEVVSVGSAAKLVLETAPPGAPYQMATALGHATKLSLGSCSICLNPDALFFLSISGNPLFTSYSGTIAANGQAVGAYSVPNIPALVGICLSHAAVTINPTCCSNTVTSEIVP